MQDLLGIFDLIGAVVTTLLFNLGKLLIAQYLGRESVSSVYGAAGSLAILMLWVYYSTQVFLMGAELSWAFAKRHSLREQAAATAARALQAR